MAGARFWIVGIFLFLGCSTPQKTVSDSFDQAESQFRHLVNYEDAECTVHVNYAEPVKSAWISQLTESRKITPGSNSQIFAKVEEQEFSWQITPYRCRIVAGRSQVASLPVKEVTGDTLKKLETVLCVWLQSFFADSPVRGWRKGGGEPIELESGYQLQRGEGRILEVSKDLRRVRAELADGAALSADYSLVDGRLLPQKVEYLKHGKLNKLDQFTYTSNAGRNLLTSFWVNLADLTGQPAAYFQALVSDCTYH